MAVALVLEVSNRELTGGGVLLTGSKSNRYTFSAVLADRRSTRKTTRCWIPCKRGFGS